MTFQLAKIEHLGRGDGERLRAIRLQSLRDSPDAFATNYEMVVSKPLAFWEQQLEQLATFVAVAKARDVGMVRGAPHDQLKNAGYLISMWVAPQARRQGIGSALIDAVVDWGRTQRFRHLFLDVAELNSPAIRLYTSKGFAQHGKSGTLPPPRAHIREVQLVMQL